MVNRLCLYYQLMTVNYRLSTTDSTKTAVQRVSGRRLAHSVSGAAQLSRPMVGLLALLLLLHLKRLHLLYSDNYPTKNPPVRAGSFACVMLSKPKIPDLNRAALLGFLGERNGQHDSSFTNNASKFNVAQNELQCATCLKLLSKYHRCSRPHKRRNPYAILMPLRFIPIESGS